MSRAYFIADRDPMDYSLDPIDEETRLKIDVADYKNELMERWPDITFDEPYSMILCAVLPPVTKGRAGQRIKLVSEDTVSMKLGDTFYDFILWHRSYVPSKYRLFLYDEDPISSFEISPNTTEADIRTFIDIQDPPGSDVRGLIRNCKK